MGYDHGHLVAATSGGNVPDNWVLATRKPSTITTAATMRVEDLTTVPRNLFQYDSWQDEAWAMWRALGEANQAIGWISQSLSRVRLNAAELVPGGDEPEILVTGAAADLMRAFCGGPAGQSMFMEAWGVYGGVPGEAWMVVEREDESVPLELASWRLMPTSAVRNSRGPVEVRVGENLWRPVVEGFAAKIFKEDPQFPWKAWSPMQAALPIMRRIDLIDRRIVALMVSRLAMNGLLLIPQEGKWTIPKRFKDAANPFMEMMLESAAQNIKTPGAASAAIPILISYAAEYIEKWRLLTWPDVLPAELLTEREQEIKRLAITLNVPLSVITGLSENHWNEFIREAAAVKRYLSPPVEILADGVTKGYLHPLLKQMGEELVGPNGGKIVCWYDVSELVTPPDKSQSVKDAYDRLEANGAALRRELGLDEADRPEGDELSDQILKKLATLPATASQALQELTGVVLQAPASGTSILGPDGGAGLPAFGEQTGAQLRTAPKTQPDAARREQIATAGVRVGAPSPRPRVYNGVR